VAPPPVRTVSIVVKGERPVGTDVNVRTQFVPSLDLARFTPMVRGAGPVGTLSGHTEKTATKRPARTTAIAIAKTTTIRVRFSDEGGEGGGDNTAYGAGIIPGSTALGNGVPHREQNRFANEFCVPQRGQTAVADVQALQLVE